MTSWVAELVQLVIQTGRLGQGPLGALGGGMELEMPE